MLKFLVDGGYTGDGFASEVKELTGAVVEVAKRNELHKFEVIPKRWIVERTFGWLDKYHRFWKNCERKLYNTLQLLNLSYVNKDTEQALSATLFISYHRIARRHPHRWIAQVELNVLQSLQINFRMFV